MCPQQPRDAWPIKQNRSPNWKTGSFTCAEITRARKASRDGRGVWGVNRVFVTWPSTGAATEALTVNLAPSRQRWWFPIHLLRRQGASADCALKSSLPPKTNATECTCLYTGQILCDVSTSGPLYHSHHEERSAIRVTLFVF